MSNGIHVSHKFVAVRERTNEFLLRVLFGLANPDSVMVDPDASKIPGRRAKYSTRESALPPFQAESTQSGVAYRRPSLGRSRSYLSEEFLYALGAENRDFRRLRAGVNSGAVEHQNADCDSPFAIFKPF
jgi:hypothetical protein